MDNVKDNSYYLNKIISDLEFIIYHMESVDIEQLSKNDILFRFNAVSYDSNFRKRKKFNRRLQKFKSGYSLERHIRFKKPNCSRLRQC